MSAIFVCHSSSDREFSSIVAGAVTRVTFQLRVDNLANDPSVNSFLDFTLPGGIPLMLGNYSGITVSDFTRVLIRKRSPLGRLINIGCMHIHKEVAC